MSNKKIFSLFFLIFILVFSILLFPSSASAQSLTFLGKSVVDIVKDLINFLLSIMGGIALIVFVLSGIFYMISGDNPRRQEGAKKMVSTAVLGLILVLVSYALIALLDRILVQP